MAAWPSSATQSKYHFVNLKGAAGCDLACMALLHREGLLALAYRSIRAMPMPFR